MEFNVARLGIGYNLLFNLNLKIIPVPADKKINTCHKE